MNATRILFVVLTLTLGVGCSDIPTKVEDDGVYYTCSMHPQVVEQAPGNCPICKMPLIAVRENTTQEVGELQLNALQVQLGNIRVDSARVRLLQEELLLPGRIVLDQRRITTVSTYVMGRIEVLHFRNVDEYVTKGQPLYAIYSEELGTIVSELLFARDMALNNGSAASDPGRLERVARNKLLAYGLSDAQVHQLSTLPSAPYLVEFLSPVSGVITEVPIREGETVMQGATVMRIADLSSVWAEAQIYPADRARIRIGAESTVTLPALPDTMFRSKLAFVNPELDPSGIIGFVRSDLSNASARLRPGMQAYVHVPVSNMQALALPTDAVIRDGTGASVWVESGPGRYKVVMVAIGIEAGGFTQITHGIKEGDQVVVSGAYLLNSEYKFRQGSDPMAGMDM